MEAARENVNWVMDYCKNCASPTAKASDTSITGGQLLRRGFLEDFG
jgi:hypothetical protein